MAHTYNVKEGEIPKPQTKAIWKVFFILLGLTALEFVFVSIMASSMTRVGIFAILTIAKAVYIVGEFMHLKHEVKFLIYAIVLPMIFVAWLLIAMIVEGGSIFAMTM
jgi:cytochrome c oxidase subunit IV